jgi:hypothetical protein
MSSPKRLNCIVLSDLKAIQTPPLCVSAPIVNNHSSTSFLFLCTYRHTEKLLPLMLATSCVTMDLLPVFPSKLPAPEDRVQLVVE